MAMSDVEIECRQAIWRETLHHPRCIGEVASYYEMLTAWYADPANAKRAAEINANYIAAMQSDPRLD
jgi:hypothetical protein